ncbi:MAG: (E)-4-hydroxy-3-methylbut-2-enyl-diphosphate synthase [Simkaniaceae bacterium]|nr:(E)-4-hydroxy-3-methylbut-2-enyl-diphosphate synthase [Simkaniaceae bacterium]
MKYCESLYKTIRRPTREVMVGKVGVGGDNPLRIQSMTTSDTRDIEATIEQIMKLADYGCDIARVTVQGKKEAEACEWIKNGLIQRGYDIPLVADIHFYPPAALLVADFVDKVRINPGNYIDRRATFRVLEYTDATYAAELMKIDESFGALVEKCRKRDIAIRIGTNHGSLSDRIMNRYGDTPAGMVESALEFASVCRKRGFHNLIFSMKASNVRVMVEAYRLLSARMYELEWDYPFHLGVTEAGDGEDGIVKSAMGIGALLLDGIGDTIRTSLTADPWFEIEPCRQIVSLFEDYEGMGVSPFEVESTFGILKGQTQPVILPSEQANYEVVYLEEPRLHQGRALYQSRKAEGNKSPFLLGMKAVPNMPVRAAAELGALLLDGIGNGVALPDESLSLRILQGARLHLSKTEFIACPGCGRTLFNLQEVTAAIRSRTEHLAGVKIAIMGCIVNGPGEMADADFGYVGSKTGQIDLYVGKTCIERNIPQEEAVDRLIALIKAHDRWREPVSC